jgi:hypothetical protein
MQTPTEAAEAALRAVTNVLHLGSVSDAPRMSPLPLFGGGFVTALLQARSLYSV